MTDAGRRRQRDRFEQLVRDASGPVLATLIGHLGDFDLAEDALADAWALAAERWPVDGFPDQPERWLFTVARRRAIDRIRRDRMRGDRQAAGQRAIDLRALGDADLDDDRWRSGISDDQLRLLFTCCHPTLSLEARVALTMHTLGGLTTAEIARAFLVPETTMGQRLVRAKRKIRVAGIPYRVPAGHELPGRLAGVLRVVYLIFNEGYLASSGAAPVRLELADDAIRLGRLLAELMPDEPEVEGLLALMILHHARRDARVDAAGDLVLSEDQDRTAWHHDEIDEGCRLAEHALSRRRPGPYQLQAAIAALHDVAPTFADTDWRQIAGLYGALAGFDPSPVIRLNRAVAVAFAEGFEAGLALLDRLDADGVLASSHLLPAARADLLRRLGRTDEARAAYRDALALVRADAERRFLERRLARG